MAFYSFDTSSFMNGRRDLLPPSVFPSVWRNIEAAISDGSIRSIDVVRDELTKRDDDVSTWAKGIPDLFLVLDADVQRATREVLGDHPRLMGKGGGRNAADPFVIALAIARGGTVITEEKPTGNLERPRIPDVCTALGVPWANLIGYVTQSGHLY